MVGCGYVYILINHSMPGLIKIGRTARDPRARARELSGTSLPTPYTVAFEVFTEDYKAVEKQAHAQLADFRVAENREFFRFPLDKAINLLLELSGSLSERGAAYTAEDILDRLVARYGDDLDPAIVAVRIVQTQDRVWFETAREQEIAGYLKDQTIRRTDLAFISDAPGDNVMFPPSDTGSVNARRFSQEMNAVAIMMTTDLFHEEACQRIERERLAIKKKGQLPT